jgi:hypothetical protein
MAAVQNAPWAIPDWVYWEVSVGVFSVPLDHSESLLSSHGLAVLHHQLVAGRLIGYAMTICPAAPAHSLGVALTGEFVDMWLQIWRLRGSGAWLLASCFSSQAFNILLAPAIGDDLAGVGIRDVIPWVEPIVWVMIWGLLAYFAGTTWAARRWESGMQLSAKLIR